MRTIERVMRWWSPKWYCRSMLGRAKREREEKLKAAKSLAAVERTNLADRFDSDIFEWEAWLTEFEDTELVKRGRAMDVYLDDIPFPEREQEKEDWYRHPHDRHYVFDPFWNEVLHPDCRVALNKAIRERFPTYRKERREIRQLWITAGTVVTGLIGAATGLFAVLKK
jgi:hypothetical protein